MSMRLRAVMVLGSLAMFATHARASEGVVEAVGEAMIRGGDEVAAKQAATADALKKCVEQVVGISVRSDFTADQQETVKNNQAEFYSQVRDTLVQKSEGFIASYDVLESGAAGSVFKVKVRAQVYESKIRAEVQKLADLISAAGNPKLMLVLQEVYVDEKGSRRLAAESLVGAHLEKELLARGFELRGQSKARGVAAEGLEAYDRWLDDVKGAAAMARDQSADILIAGRIEIADKGKIEDAGAIEALRGQVRIEIASVVRGLNTASGELFSSKPVQMRSVGMTMERAVQRALGGRGENLIKQIFGNLLEDLKVSFRKSADQGQSFMVMLRGVKSFRKQGKGFLDVLGGVEGVSEVRQKAFGDGLLSVDVRCKCNAAELQERIFARTGSEAVFSTLDIESVSGKQLSFKL